MKDIVTIRPWLEELRNELNEVLQKYVGEVSSAELRHNMYITVEDIVDKYRNKGYCDSRFNVWWYLDLNIKRSIDYDEGDKIE